MKRKEYEQIYNELRYNILMFKIDNGIESEWMIRMLLDVMQNEVVRFKDDE